MKIKTFILLILIFIGSSVINIITAQPDIIAQPEISAQEKDSSQIDNFNFIIGKSIINKSLWSQPYRYENKELKTLSVKMVIERRGYQKKVVDFNLLSLLIDSAKVRIKPTGIFYYKADKKIYLKSKPLNQNYNVFEEFNIDGYQNLEEKTYKINFLGLKKKNKKPSVQSLKKITIKKHKISYYVDFPVHEQFSYGKIYYKNKPVGFAAVK